LAYVRNTQVFVWKEVTMGVTVYGRGGNLGSNEIDACGICANAAKEPSLAITG